MGNSFVQKFIFDKLPIRGAYVDLTDVWQTIAAQKEYTTGIRQVLGELMAANILMMSNVKLHGKIIAQIQDNPKLDLVVSECDHDMHVRATAKFERSIHEDNQVNYTDCIKHGTLVISIDSNNDGKIYQSVVALAGHDLSQVLTEYMLQSEQLRALFVIGYSETRVVGFMLQQLPDQGGMHNDEINRIFMLAETLTQGELLHYELNNILHRLFNEDDIVLFDAQKVQFKCTCGRERVSSMLRSLGQEEALSIIAEEGSITVTCDFCNTVYSFNEQDVRDMFSTLCVDIECVSQEIH